MSRRRGQGRATPRRARTARTARTAQTARAARAARAARGGRGGGGAGGTAAEALEDPLAEGLGTEGFHRWLQASTSPAASPPAAGSGAPPHRSAPASGSPGDAPPPALPLPSPSGQERAATADGAWSHLADGLGREPRTPAPVAVLPAAAHSLERAGAAPVPVVLAATPRAGGGANAGGGAMPRVLQVRRLSSARGAGASPPASPEKALAEAVARRWGEACGAAAPGGAEDGEAETREALLQLARSLAERGNAAGAEKVLKRAAALSRRPAA